MLNEAPYRRDYDDVFLSNSREAYDDFLGALWDAIKEAERLCLDGLMDDDELRTTKDVIADLVGDVTPDECCLPEKVVS